MTDCPICSVDIEKACKQCKQKIKGEEKQAEPLKKRWVAIKGLDGDVKEGPPTPRGPRQAPPKTKTGTGKLNRVAPEP